MTIAGSLTPTTFWFLRHGETDWNIDSLAQGNVDIPLNQTGLAQARTSAGKLRNRGIRTIVSSPLSRARDTANIVAEALGLPVEFDEGLREVAFGVNEGKPIAEQWFLDWLNGVATPEGAESFASLRARAAEAINRAVAKTAPVLVVAHGGFFRALRADMGLEPNVRLPNGTPYFCEPGSPWVLSEAK
jgi:broad specificity phosphatase PhoE